MDPFIIASRIAQLPGEITAPEAPPITPEEIATAVQTFKYEITSTDSGMDEDPDGKSFWYTGSIIGTFDFRGMKVTVRGSWDGSDMEYDGIGDEDIEPLAEFDEDVWNNWIATYITGEFDWDPILSVIADKHESRIDDLVRDGVSDSADTEAEARDPYGYRGLKRSDFY